MQKFKISSFALAICFSLTSCQSLFHPIRSEKERKDSSVSQATGSHYAVATQGRYSSKAAEKMFALGGNIIDAAVAASFTISVERPQSTGLGGGGFMLFHEAKTGRTYAVDFRERAPLKAFESMYLSSDGKADTSRSQNGLSSVAVPGLVAGLIEIHQKFGSLPLEVVLQPAIDLAQTGFDIYPEFYQALQSRAQQILKDPSAKKIFLDPQGKVPPLGSVLVQSELAETLKMIAKKGRDGFYKGSVAQAIVDVSKKNQGYLAQKDLDDYAVKWREPVKGYFKGYEVLSMHPPSSGGIHVLQFLNFLESDNLKESGIHSTKAIHLAAAALQSAFADRATYLGDPDFTHIPIKALTSPFYIHKKRQEVRLDRARKSSEVKAGDVFGYESPETTHLSLMDDQGNAVSTTQTINGWMGSGVVAPGTGVVLNNEMDDFSAQVGSSNLFGAIGGKANSIAPKKTPLSSMSPTLLMKAGRPSMVVGAPGGTRIISCVAQTILNYVEFQTSLYDAVAAVRYHHQWQPDVLSIEAPGPSAKVVSELKNMGYNVKIEPIGCNVMAVAKEGSVLRGVADPRDIGTSIAH